MEVLFPQSINTNSPGKHFIVMVINANWSLVAYISSDLRMSLIISTFVYTNGVCVIFKVKRKLVSLPTGS